MLSAALRRWTLFSGALIFLVSCAWGLFADFAVNYKTRMWQCGILVMAGFHSFLRLKSYLLQ